MRFSAVATLCAAPLALAGSLQANLERREAVNVQVSQNVGSNPLVVQAAGGSATEIIIIWVNNGGGAATQTINQPVTVTTTVTAGAATVAGAAAAATTHNVTVGGSAGLVYSPDTIEAAVGDFVLFKFESQNHTVTQSAFTTPCDALTGGMDSGFMANPNNTVNPQPMMQMQVTVATPLWFYCRQSGHCGKGMAFSINPTANKTQAMFKSMAIAQNGTGAPAVIAGGSGSAVAPPPPAATASSVAPPPPAASAIASGAGTLAAGSCECSCLCAPGSFPSSAIQGLGAFGGVPGAMPMAALTS